MTKKQVSKPSSYPGSVKESKLFTMNSPCLFADKLLRNIKKNPSGNNEDG